MRHQPDKVPDAPPVRPAVFDVGSHKVVVAKIMEGRWTAEVDGRLLDASFGTQSQAWEAGVRDAYRREAPGGA